MKQRRTKDNNSTTHMYLNAVRQTDSESAGLRQHNVAWRIELMKSAHQIAISLENLNEFVCTLCDCNQALVVIDNNPSTRPVGRIDLCALLRSGDWLCVRKSLFNSINNQSIFFSGFALDQTQTAKCQSN